MLGIDSNRLLHGVFQQAQMPTPPSLPVSSPAAQPGSVAGSGHSQGSMGPGSVGGPPSNLQLPNSSQANSHPHCPPIRQNSPSPARSLTPTPHHTPPGLPGSQTPQPHTPNPPQVAAPLPQQQLASSQPMGQGMNSEKPSQLQQQTNGGGASGGLPTGQAQSVPTQNAHVPTQLPRTPVSSFPIVSLTQLLVVVRSAVLWISKLIPDLWLYLHTSHL